MTPAAMLYTVFVGAAMLLAAAYGAAYLRRHGRAERGVWLGALILSLALPLGMMTREGRPASGEQTATIVAPAPEGPVYAGLEALPVTGSTSRLPDVLAALWLLASLALVVRWVVARVRMGRLSRSWRTGRVDGVDVSLTQGFGPAVTGAVRPRIVLPNWVVDLPPDKRRLVVRHEVEHLRVGDPWLLAVGRLARVITPWNPVVWMLHSRLAQAVELDCDRRVLRSYPDVASYGETLLAVSAGPRRLAAAAFAESNVPLRRRILAMTTPPTKLKFLGSLGVAAVGAVLLAGAVRVPAPRMELSLDAPIRALTALRGARQQATLPPPRVISGPNRYPFVLVITGTNADTTMLDVRLANGQVVTGSLPEVDALLTSIADSIRGPVLLRYPMASDADPYYPQTSEDVTRGPRILNPEEVIEATAAAYPPRLRGTTGTVAMQFLLDETGEVRRVRVGQVSMYPDFDQAALEVAETYRFSPAERDGEPVPVWVVHPVIFRPQG